MLLTQELELATVSNRSSFCASLVLRSMDLMQHSLSQHVLSNRVMFLARDRVHRLKDEFQSVHVLTSSRRCRLRIVASR